METILVGVDGSDNAHEALERAAEEAALHHAALQIVSAWDIPSVAFMGGYAAGTDQSLFEDVRGRAEKVVRDAIAVVGEIQPSVSCSGEAVQGQAASVLLERAAEDDLVVVGSRGRGGFASLLLGSTSQQVVHHARCPVLIVHHP